MSSPKRLRVGVLFGGRSGEHEVSLASAASVIRALNAMKRAIADKFDAIHRNVELEKSIGWPIDMPALNDLKN